MFIYVHLLEHSSNSPKLRRPPFIALMCPKERFRLFRRQAVDLRHGILSPEYHPVMATWWLIPRIVSGLVHPNYKYYKWINPTYPM